MDEWAVIPASERAQIAAATHRTTVRATVLANRHDVERWARAHGMEWSDLNHQRLVDAYIAAKYEEQGPWLR